MSTRARVTSASDDNRHVGWWGVLGLGIAAAIALGLRLPTSWAVLCLLAGCAVPLAVCEGAGNIRWRDMFSRPNRRTLRQRLAGLLLQLGIWACMLAGFNAFSNGTVAGFWEVAFVAWPLAVLLGLLFLLFADQGSSPTLQTLGANLLRETPVSSTSWAALRIQVLKAFFLPIMIGAVHDWLAHSERNLNMIATHPMGWYLLVFTLLYLVDVVFAAVGYLVTSRRLQSHIRSTDSTWSGWIVALACYPPLFVWLEQLGLRYKLEGRYWYDLLGTEGILSMAWASGILILTSVYTWATIAFGLRFSNLTHRGIVSDGPYRYVKHPAYLAKNVSWWLISVPFLSGNDAGSNARQCAALLTINAIYYLRAKTEERHLRSDPKYRAYEMWIAEHGLWARFHKAWLVKLRLGR